MSHARAHVPSIETHRTGTESGQKLFSRGNRYYMRILRTNDAHARARALFLRCECVAHDGTWRGTHPRISLMAREAASCFPRRSFCVIDVGGLRRVLLYTIIRVLRRMQPVSLRR